MGIFCIDRQILYHGPPGKSPKKLLLFCRAVMFNDLWALERETRREKENGSTKEK